eukprot:823741-Pyramimonas_sp.AAC.1
MKVRVPQGRWDEGGGLPMGPRSGIQVAPRGPSVELPVGPPAVCGCAEKGSPANGAFGGVPDGVANRVRGVPK